MGGPLQDPQVHVVRDRFLAPRQGSEVAVPGLDQGHAAGDPGGIDRGGAAARAVRVPDGIGQARLRRSPARTRTRCGVPAEIGTGPVEDGDASAQLVGEKLGDIAGCPAAEHDTGQGFVDRLRSFDDGDVLLDLPVREPQFPQGGPARLVETGVVEGDRGVIGERAQQRDLVGLEGPLGAVGGEQGAHRLAPDDQRHAEKRDEFLGPGQAVEVRIVDDEGRAGVVAYPVRALGGQHLAAQPHIGRYARRQERGGDRSLRCPGGQPAVGADQRQVGEVGADQVVGVMDDRLQDLVELAQRGERLGRRVQRRQLALPVINHGTLPPRLRVEEKSTRSA